MLFAILASASFAADCVPRGEYIVTEDNIMLMAADVVEDMQIAAAAVTTDAGILTGRGEGTETVEAADLEDQRLASGWVIEDDIIFYAGLAAEEYALIAGMGTEVLVFFSGGPEVDEDNVFHSEAVSILPASEDIEVPEGAVELMVAPTCR